MTKHLFLIDPIEKLNLSVDTSLHLAAALYQKKEKVFALDPSTFSLFMDKDKGVKIKGTIKELTFKNWQASSLNIKSEKDEQVLDLKNWVVYMRKDPPFNSDYLAVTYLLDQCPAKKIINAPKALRDFNEKLSLFYFKKEVVSSCLSLNSKSILNWAKQNGFKELVLKPLDLFAGHGVRRQKTNTSFTLSDWTLAQPYLKEVEKGEVRAFCAFGKAVSWALKVPKKGSFLANTRMGAQVFDYKPTKKEIALVEQVSFKLAKEGIEFVGFDVIGGKISEINVTSPRLLTTKDNMEEAYKRLSKLVLKKV